MLKELKRCLKIEKKDENIFDIVIYGSSVKGKSRPGDTDVLVIFRSGSLKDRLNRIQEIKKKINPNHKIDIKCVLWDELFQPEFFARTGIFLEGVSVFDDKNFSRKIGFEGSVRFLYDLKDKTHSEKVKFNYVLSGRNTKGLVETLDGRHLAPGVVEIPTANSLEFEEVLKRYSINFKKQSVLKKI